MCRNVLGLGLMMLKTVCGWFFRVKVISVKGGEGTIKNLLFKKWFVIFVVCCTQIYLFLV